MKLVANQPDRHVRRCMGSQSQGRGDGFTRANGFTLVELLVVIGIIALLIAMLLPALNKAREASRQVKCLSNLRNLAQAVNMFANDNHGYMPGVSGSGVIYWDESSRAYKSAASADAKAGLCSDWIAWQRVKDPISGITQSGADQNITFSGLAKYMNIKESFHASPDQANTMSPQLEELFRCPSDVLDSRPKNSGDNNGGRGAYRYSYSMNSLVGCKAGSGTGIVAAVSWPSGAGNPPAAPTGYDPKATRSWGKYNGKIAGIHKPSEIILLVCEDEQTLDDGSFAMNPYSWFDTSASAGINAVASRHTYPRATAKGNVGLFQAMANQNSRGNVSFCDGHAEFMSRVDALRQVHSGNPYPDPLLSPF